MSKTKKEFNIIYLILGLIIVLAISLFAFKMINRNNSATENNNSTNNINNTTNANSNTKNNNASTNEANLNFKIKDIKCSKGQEITVEVEMLNDSDFVAANFEYNYDSDSLEYIDYKVGNSLENAAMFIVNDDKDNHKVLIGFVAKPEEEKEIKSGKIIDINFKVKDNLTATKIDNKFDCTTLKQEDGTDIKFNIQQGKIEIQ